MKRIKIVFVFIFLLTIVDVLASVVFSFFPLEFQNEVNEYSKEFNLDPSLVYSIIKTESDFNSYAISKSGAVGLMQIMPKTAEFVNSQIDGDNINFNLNDPATNIKYGCFYLRYLLDKNNQNLKIALACYNAGEGVVGEWINSGVVGASFDVNKIPYKETRDYLRKVLLSLEFYNFRIRFN